MNTSPVARHFDSSEVAEFCSAVASDLIDLAVLHNAEPDVALIDMLKTSGFPSSLGLNLTSEPGREGLKMIEQALAGLSAPIAQETLDELATDYVDIYLNYRLRASPNESVWLDEDHLERQLPMFQVREYYRRHHVAPADWKIRTEDHLVLQLQFVARLLSEVHADNDLEPVQEAARFMDEHLLRWIMEFATRVANRCATGYFAALALLTGAYCEELRDTLVELLGEPRPSAEEIEKRLAPPQTAQVIPMQYLPGVGPSV